MTSRHLTVLLLAATLAVGARASDADETVFGATPAWRGLSESTYGAALGDIDGDGDLDLVLGNNGAPSLYRNIGGTFSTTRAWTGTIQPTTSVALGDVDGDGDLDLVCGNDHTWPALYANTAGSFSAAPVWGGPVEFTFSVALGDIDGDGRLDLVCGNSGQGSTLHLNNYFGKFVDSPAWVGPAMDTRSVALGDVDGDGDLDLVLGNHAQGSALFLNVGGRFGVSAVWTSPAMDTRSVALGDVDGDGDLDLLLGNFDQNSLLYLNTGGVFAASPAWTGPAAKTNTIAFGDVDADGDLDLVMGSTFLGATTLFLNDGGALSTTPAWTGPAEATYCALLGDVDGDADLDLVRGNFGQNSTLYLNTSGAFSASPAWEGPVENTGSEALGDVDGDGDLDLVSGLFPGGARLYRNNGGTFSTIPDWSGPQANVRNLALADVDGDGDLDLVVGNDLTGAELYRNVGGTFSAAPVWTGTHETVWNVVLGDVDGDGDVDLVYAAQQAKLYLNSGGLFSATPDWVSSTAGATICVALGDVDGDGDLDLVRGNYGGLQGSAVHLNVGGTFASTPAWTGPVEYTNAVALADVDGDGDPDLVRGNISQGSTLYRNTGGNFENAPAWTGPVQYTFGVALGDLDGDGDLDLVTGNGEHGGALFLNTGGMFTTAAAWVGPVDSTRSLALGDVDGDGDLDLVLGNHNRYRGAMLYRRRSPWNATGTPLLPNNPAFLRAVRAAPMISNHYRVSFRAFDAESDPVWVLGEYQLEASGAWHPMNLDDGPLRAGPFQTSPAGLDHELEWNVTQVPFDRRSVVIRLRASSLPRRVGAIQTIPTYVTTIGRVVPERADMATSPGSLVFPTRTIGDSAAVTLTIANGGNRDLVLGAITSPDSDLVIQGPSSVTVPPGQQRALNVLLAPRRPLSAIAPLHLVGNDPVHPSVDIPIVTDVRPLAFESRLLVTADSLPLGEAATVVVTPAPLVHIERGFVVFRARGAAAFTDSSPVVPQGSSFAALVPGSKVTEAGLEYFVRVENSGLFATDPPNAPDSTYRFAVAAPIRIQSIAETGPGGLQPAGTPTTVIVSLPGGSEFDSGRLYYRRGGEAVYDSSELRLVEIAPDVLAPVDTIPGSAAGPRGVEYWVQVRTRTRTLTDPATSPAERPHVVRTTVSNLAESATHAGGRYRMVSIPLDLELPPTATLEAILGSQPEFGPYDPRHWRAYRYVPDSHGLVELSAGAAAGGALRPEPGRAFWLIAKKTNRVDTDPVPGRSTPTDSPFHLTLGRGWNQVGDPFDFPVDWSAIRAEGSAGQVALEPPVAWDEEQRTYRADDVTQLRPFEGYWVWNPTQDPLDLLVPPVEAGLSLATVGAPSRAVAAPSTAETSIWSLRLGAFCGEALDLRNVAGVATGAQEGGDPQDRTEPPASPGPSVSLYFIGDGEPVTHRTVDLRPPIAAAGDPAERGHAWAFDVDRSADVAVASEVRLTVSGVAELPGELDARLIDRALEKTIDLRLSSDYTFVGARRAGLPHAADTRFELIVGTPAFAARAQAAIDREPRLTRLFPIAPNPVVSGAVIRFETAAPGRLRLELFDLSGRRVRTLVNGDVSPGAHELAWTGTDDRGHPLPPGVYSLHLATPDRTDARRIVKIR